MSGGVVEMRRVNDLGVISSFKLHSKAVTCICELEDGSFVSGSLDNKMKRWDGSGRVLQIFHGHSKPITGVIELKRDVIMGSSVDNTMTMWKLSTEERLRTLTFPPSEGRDSVVFGINVLVKLSEDKVLTSSKDTIRVWSASKGECIDTVSTGDDIGAMVRLGDVVVTATLSLMAVWKLKYDLISSFSHLLYLFSSSKQQYHISPPSIP